MAPVAPGMPWIHAVNWRINTATSIRLAPPIHRAATQRLAHLAAATMERVRKGEEKTCSARQVRECSWLSHVKTGII